MVITGRVVVMDGVEVIGVVICMAVGVVVIY